MNMVSCPHCDFQQLDSWMGETECIECGEAYIIEITTRKISNQNTDDRGLYGARVEKDELNSDYNVAIYDVYLGGDKAEKIGEVYASLSNEQIIRVSGWTNVKRYAEMRMYSRDASTLDEAVQAIVHAHTADINDPPKFE